LKFQVKKTIKIGFWQILDWVYPPSCAVCGMPGYSLCGNCQAEIKFITGKICQNCGKSVDPKKNFCNDCRKGINNFDGVRSLAYYGGVVRDCIHALKYENNRTLGKYFAGLLHPIMKREPWPFDVVVPVPLSYERMKERGYNQAASIARPLALFLDLPYQTYCLEQVRDTRSQVGLSAEERRENVIDAFKAVPELIRNRNILLVDDVMTTGATLNACSIELKKAGAEKVYCATIARFSG